jgi:hypothetical protein
VRGHDTAGSGLRVTPMPQDRPASYLCRPPGRPANPRRTSPDQPRGWQPARHHMPGLTTPRHATPPRGLPFDADARTAHRP